jgi:hypothetical protein
MHAKRKQRYIRRPLTTIVAAIVVLIAGLTFGGFAISGIGSAASDSQWSCTSSASDGDCPFPADSQITGPADLSNPYVDNNIWSPISGYTSTVSANSPQDWQAVVNAPAGNTGVVAFTNVGVDLGDPVNSFSQITGTVAENMNATANTSSWAMYDNWLNNWNDEVMIQYDFAGNGDCTPVATAQFGGSNGVPVQTWHLCDFTSPGDSGQTLDWKLGAGEGSKKQSEPGGSFDLLAMTQWLETHTAPADQQLGGYTTYLPAASSWTAISNGWEIASTGGVSETYSMSNYGLTMVEGGTTTTTTTTTTAPDTTTTASPVTTTLPPTTTTTEPPATTTTTTSPETIPVTCTGNETTASGSSFALTCKT